MLFEYLPGDKMLVDGIPIIFREGRESIRKRLGGKYQPDDQTISLGDPGTESIQRRDIYAGLHTENCLFFLNYNLENELIEVEIHLCDRIRIFDHEFPFGQHLDTIARQLSRFAPITSQEKGSYSFSDLHLILMDEDQMGGSGNGLGYLYCYDPGI